MDFIRKNYVYINITLLILAIYVIFFPIISLGIEQINPNFTKCVYLQITGKECPLCGGTRYIKGLGNVFQDITYLFNFFGAVIGVLVFNIIFRITNLLKIKNKKNIDNIIIFDFIFHFIMFIMYIVYEIVFLINN